jgi:hypothetical protein
MSLERKKTHVYDYFKIVPVYVSARGLLIFGVDACVVLTLLFESFVQHWDTGATVSSG